MSFQLTFNYKHNSPVSAMMGEQVEDVENALSQIRESKSDLVSIDSVSGGVLIRKSELTGGSITEYGDDGRKLSERKINFNEGESVVAEKEEFGPVEPEVIPPDQEVGHVAIEFQSFREKVINSMLRQDSWMRKIVEKSMEREEKLQRVAAKLDDDNDKLESILDEKFGVK